MGQKSVGNPSMSVIYLLEIVNLMLTFFYYNKLLICKNLSLVIIQTDFIYFINSILLLYPYFFLYFQLSAIFQSINLQILRLLSVKFMIELESIVADQQNEIISMQNLTCVKNNPAYLVCTEIECPYTSICCQNNQCQCNKIHQNCAQIRLKALLQKIYSKTIDVSPMSNKVTTLFSKIIDQISQIYQQSQKIIKNYGLLKPQIQFLNYLKEDRYHSLSGKVVYQANKFSKLKYTFDLRQFQNSLDKFWSQTEGLFWEILYSTRKLLELPTQIQLTYDHANQKFFNDMIQKLQIKIDQIKSSKKKEWQKQHKVEKSMEKQKQQSDKKNSKTQKSYQNTFSKIDQESQNKKMNQLCQYLSGILGLSPNSCLQFVKKNGYDENGQLLSKQQIFSVFLQHGEND